ncbi:cytochrome P450 [Gymnopus androsaceus JB14]|uniref:Cytochrome P450 n=1 Tax=Gymnopus androsaceus JB14 TaxID=1447944 RepID=A0A6A4HP36_9AGAR|nr:cytochrome P450 [Gymnopus androsaceus JB14]
MEGATLSPAIIVAMVLGLVFVAWHHRNSGSNHKLPLPPGPTKLPLLGNVLDMPSSFQWIKFSQWAEKFDSDILHLEVAGTDYIVLNSYDAATDLLEKRSSIYSGRPHYTMLCDLVGWSGDLVLMPYGNEWKSHRKLFQQEFHPANSSLYLPHEKKALRAFLKSLLDAPEEWGEHTQHLLGAIILGVAYGLHVQPKDDPYIETARKMSDVLTNTLIPGEFLVDSFPILKYVPSWFPGASFKRKASSWNGIRNATITPPFTRVQKAMVNGTAEDCFTLRCLQRLERPERPDPGRDNLSVEEQIIKNTAGTMFEGGSDTGSTALLTFILAMLCFPHAQREAQEELDEVIGKERLPDPEDEDSLPYVKALMYECFRWETVLPLCKYFRSSLPHQVDRDDTYKGYFIPKHSTVIPNVWGMLRDEKTYGPNAHLFEPKRWLLKGSDQRGWKLNPEMREPTGISFGFGRRVCPGKHMALSSFWLSASSLLHSFNITPAIDKDGNPIEPKVEYVSGAQNRPAPFQCTIKPRSEEHAVLIRQALDSNLE